MVTDIDTSPEAVERHAKGIDPPLRRTATLLRQLAKERDEAQAKVRELEEALKPFAEAASTYDKCDPARPMRFVWEFNKTLTVSHLRAAREALTSPHRHQPERPSPKS